MKESVRQKALELGFDVCRFTDARPPASTPHLTRWIEAGHHGDMQWMARQEAKRADLHKVLPNIRSVVCLAVNYASSPPPGQPIPTSNRGVVARYARHADYHTVLGPRLQALAEFIDALGNTDTRSLGYLDTGPILERDLAERAGIGFIGKHTNLISRSLGNWILLAEILTTLELQPDLPERNRCGTCSRCLDACPTQAFTAPFQLDARRCISYLTIELKGPIPIELRPAIGNRIFGCDDCLDACPWNRFASEAHLMREVTRDDLDQPDLIDLLALDETAFKSRFSGTPLLRPKRRGLLRNVCVALGNIGDATALPSLHRAMCDPESLIAEHAAWAARQIEVRITASKSRQSQTNNC